MEMKNVVRCTPGQYKELLTNGQIEVNGEIKTLSDTTLYDTGYLDFIEWYNKIMEAQYKQVAVNHTPMAMKSLEQEYEELTNGIDGKASKNVSAIGYTAILKKGDTVKVTLPNYGTFFVNGELVTNDYTYNGDGYEVVNVWCFEGKSNPNDPMELTVPPHLEDTPTFNITELDVRNISQTPVVGDGYKNYALVLKAYNYSFNNFNNASVKKLVSTGSDKYNQPVVAMYGAITEIESDCKTLSLKCAFNALSVKKIRLPEVTTIQYQMFTNTNNRYGAEIYTPKLETIIGGNGAEPFMGVKTVILPSTVREIKGKICGNNYTIILNCNRASITPDWCSNTPTENFTICDDWQADINIAVAAKNHTKDWFIDLFTNKLHDFYADYKDIIDDPSYSGEVPLKKFITIPKDTYNLLSATEEGIQALEIASNKYWQVEFPAT